MLVFNELRITPDNKKLIIDVLVQDFSYFDGVTIDSIHIDTLDSWVPDGPSDNARVVYEKKHGYALDLINDGTGRHVRIELGGLGTNTESIFNPAKNNMYFVYVIADISNAPNVMQAPCLMSHDRLIGTVINLQYLYRDLILGIKELEDDCSNPVHLIDIYLKQKAIDASIRAGNYPIAIKYWKMFFMDIKDKNLPYKTCGCYGRV